MKTRILRIVIVLVLMGSMLFGAMDVSLQVMAKPDESDYDEEELEQRHKDTLTEINNIKSDIKSVEQKIKDLEESKSSLQTYIDQLDQQVNSLSGQITDLEDKIERKKSEIEEKTEELLEAEEEEAEQYEMMKKRIQYMYEQGNQSFVVLLLESENLSDMMNRAEYAVQMAAYDRKMMVELQEIREVIAGHHAVLEQEKKEQEELLAELQNQKEALNKAISAKTQEIASYQSQINSAAGDQEEYEKQLAEQEKLLEQVENQIAAAAAARAAAADGDGGASGFIWPCPSSHRITSNFDARSAPVAGASTNHKGIDIGASSGSAIVAASGGRVTTAAYSSSAGNYVVISHGNGIATVYMHASALYVSEGAVVSKGQKIAAVGSTGYSTGPHLHFGVILNGSYVNPLNYVN